LLVGGWKIKIEFGDIGDELDEKHIYQIDKLLNKPEAINLRKKYITVRSFVLPMCENKVASMVLSMRVQNIWRANT